MVEALIIAVALLVAPAVFLIASAGCASLKRVTPPDTTTPTSTPPPENYKKAVSAEPGLVSYWRLGESMGPTAKDENGIANGIYQGSPNYGQAGAMPKDSNDKAIELKGDPQNPDYVESQSFVMALNPPMAFSVEAWIAPESGSPNPNQTIVSSYDYAPHGYALVLDRSATPPSITGVVYPAGTGKKATAQIAVGGQPAVWSQVVMTFTQTGKDPKTGTPEGTITLYVNGQQAGQPVTQAQYQPNDTTLLRIGSGVDPNGKPAYVYKGSIDEVSIYNVALDSGAVSAHYKASGN